MTMLTLRTLFFEDLAVGMTERLSKTVDASDVVGFAAVTAAAAIVTRTIMARR